MGNAYSTLKKEGTKMSGGDQHVLLVGNPGTGKSTIVTGIVGRVVFRSGFSAGTGMTTCMQTVEHEGVIYSDTPGLDDVNTRETAGREIATALRQNGTYRLIFVVTLEAGRVRSADIATMKIVLDAIDLPTEVPFGIIINKLSKKAMTKLARKRTGKRLLRPCRSLEPMRRTFSSTSLTWNSWMSTMPSQTCLLLCLSSFKIALRSTSERNRCPTSSWTKWRN